MPDSDAGRKFVQTAREKSKKSAHRAFCWGRGGRDALVESVSVLQKNGATLVLCGGSALPGPAYRFGGNHIVKRVGRDFLKQPHALQTEAFGPVALLVVSRDTAQTLSVLKHIEGNFDGDDLFGHGRFYRTMPSTRWWNQSGTAARRTELINDKMPTGVAVSPAMNHGGPFPATGHPGFTAVGLPASIQRFRCAALL